MALEGPQRHGVQGLQPAPLRRALHQGDVLELREEPAVDLGERVHRVHRVAPLQRHLHGEQPAVGGCVGGFGGGVVVGGLGVVIGAVGSRWETRGTKTTKPPPPLLPPTPPP